jgi:hypothetical protein
VLRYLLLFSAAAAVVIGAFGCGGIKGVDKIKTVVVKDVALEDQLALAKKYQRRHAWTRGAIEDLTERPETPNEPKRRVILRDTKVTVIDLNLVYEGSVTVEDPKGRRIVAAMNCEPPLSVERVEKRLSELFWFDDPTIRHVDYIRKWGKSTARSVMNHEVFAGMPAEAARESWGIPDEVVASETQGVKEERWKYKEGKRTKYLFMVGGVVGRFEE